MFTKKDIRGMIMKVGTVKDRFYGYSLTNNMIITAIYILILLPSKGIRYPREVL